MITSAEHAPQPPVVESGLLRLGRRVSMKQNVRRCQQRAGQQRLGACITSVLLWSGRIYKEIQKDVASVEISRNLKPAN
jgi:hypothetical protein